MALKIIHENPNIPSEASFAIKNIQSHAFLINFVSSNMNLPVREKQRVLSIYDLQDSAIESLKLMNVEYQKLELKNDIQSKVRTDLDQQQREYYLNQQMKPSKRSWEWFLLSKRLKKCGCVPKKKNGINPLGTI